MLESHAEAGHLRILDAKNEILCAIEKQRSQHQVVKNDAVTEFRDMMASAPNKSRELHAQSLDNGSNEALYRQEQIAEIPDYAYKHPASTKFSTENTKVKLKKEEKLQRIQDILASLSFQNMRQRREEIKEAHSATFQWIFTNDDNVFKNWLRDDGGIFWVNGKAGSGKSTLMKFLAKDERTRHLLLDSPSTSLVIVDFYFWYVGSKLQKSEEGLLRSILYQILHKCPELIPYAAPRRWENQLEASDSWSISELHQALENIALSENATWPPRSWSTTDRGNERPYQIPKFCFFIDGLDEYQADHLRLIELLQTLSENLKIKICVSSRPWNAFQKAFGHLQDQLVLEDLTRKDITSYVHEELREPTLDDGGIRRLADEVASKAQGVFLWVYLTVRSLKEGIAEGDSISILRERVTTLPSDLGEYFELILSRVHPVYKRAKTMTALYMAASATREKLRGRKTLSSPTRTFLNFWLLRQGIDDPKFAIRQKITHLDSYSCQQYWRETQTFLSASCKDLLYLPPSSKVYAENAQVEFLHRTVFEFLESDTMKAQIEAGTMLHVRERHFNMSMAVARMKFVDNKYKLFHRAFDMIEYAVTYDLDLSTDLGESLLLEIERLSACAFQNFDEHAKSDSIDRLLPTFDALLQRRRYLFVTGVIERSKKINQSPWCLDFILRAALGLKDQSKSWSEHLNVTFLRYLLSLTVSGYGSSPPPVVNVNVRMIPTATSPWEEFLHKCLTSVETSKPHPETTNTYRCWNAAKILIQHGADLHATLQNGSTAKEALECIVPLEFQDELEALYSTDLEVQPHSGE